MENLLSKAEMEAVINGDHGNVFSVLGIHKDKGSKEVFIRAYQPHAVSIEVLRYDDSPVGFMTRLDDRGFFQINLGAVENFPYRFRIENDMGHKYIKEDEYRFPPVLGDIDVYLLAEGNHLEMYKKLGAHPMEINGVKGVGFAVWAPNAKRVSVVGAFNNWDGRAHVMRKHPTCGVWDIFVPGIGEGEFYKYEVKTPEDYILVKSDPVGFYAEKRPNTASVVYDINRYQWSDENWMKYREQANSFDRPMSIYEVHLGSWRRKENNEFMTYRELADTLVPYVTNMGFTHVEFLPLCEHPLDCSWGYQVVGMFAPTSRFGTPDDLRYLIDKFHEAGIGVIMDFVPVHFAANADALAKFDGTYLYEYDSDVGQSEWGTCNFNYYRREVCSFLSSAAGLWMDVYHCDGIRMDAISRALYWQGDPNRGVNQGAVNFLRSLNHGLNERWPTGIYMAEDSTNFLKVTAPTRYEGVGFDYKWDMGWMHDTLDYFATPFGERPGCYGKLLFSMHYFYNELYLLALSHDEVVHGKKTIIDKLWGSYAEKCAQLRTLYFYMYTHPGKKLNFMGNELAHFREWDEKRELDWNLLEYPFHDAFQKYFAALSRTYASEPALYDGEYNPDCFEWVANESCAEGVYAWLRKGRGQNLLCVMNTQDHAHKKFPLYLKFPCSAELVLDTEAGTWGGVHKAHRKQSFHTTDGGVFGRDYTLTLDLPAMGSYLLRLSPEAPNPDAARLSANRALAQKRKAAKAAKATAEVSDK